MKRVIFLPKQKIEIIFVNFRVRRWGSLLPGLLTRDPPLSPPSTYAEIFRPKCLQSHLKTSPQTHRSQLLHFMGHQLEAHFIASWTVLIQLINFAFYSIKIPLVMAEIAYSQLPHFMGNQLEPRFIASQNVLIKQTNFAFYSIKIRPVMDEIAYSQLPHFMGHQLEASFIAKWDVLIKQTNFAF